MCVFYRCASLACDRDSPFGVISERLQVESRTGFSVEELSFLFFPIKVRLILPLARFFTTRSLPNLALRTTGVTSNSHGVFNVDLLDLNGERMHGALLFSSSPVVSFRKAGVFSPRFSRSSILMGTCCSIQRCFKLLADVHLDTHRGLTLANCRA